jgi:phosphoribosylformimino-5-aminoimidazole carboxamide ribonucleotide (ProFAR) isomerase
MIERINAYARAGVEEMMLQWAMMDDIEGLQVLAEDVLPYIAIGLLSKQNQRTKRWENTEPYKLNKRAKKMYQEGGKSVFLMTF